MGTKVLAVKRKMRLRLPKILGGITRQLLSSAFVFAALGTAVYSVEKVVWIDPQPRLLLILLLAIITTLLVANIKLPAAVKHVFILLTGLLVYLWQISVLVSPQPWWQALQVKPNETTIYFSSFLVLGAWLTGYVSAWSMLIKRNGWIPIFLGTTILLVNLNNLPPNDYYVFFPAFVFASVLLLGYSHLEKQFAQLGKCSQSYSRIGIILYSAIVIVLGFIVSFSAKFLPDIQFDPEKALTSKISWNHSREQWFNIFAYVDEKVNAAVFIKPQNMDIHFSDPPSGDKTPVFSVNSDSVKYLRLRRYDVYLSDTWTINHTIDNMFNPPEGILPTNLNKRKEFTYTVTNKATAETILITGELKSINLPALVQTLPTEPPSMADIISVSAARDILPNGNYTVTTWVSEATPIELFQAGTDYPDWVKQRYLQLPESLPDRIQALSHQLTENSETPYEKAIEIKKFLQRFTYNVIFNTPPEGVDAVDYFLFEKKAGDCTYFSSAMAVMLRSLGVPARISTGYRILEKDPEGEQYIARARDYHARPEVFFPKYGWIEFEVTPGLPGLATEDADVDLEQLIAELGVADNVTPNGPEKLKVNYVNYDEEGNLLDEFGEPIYEDVVNPGALPPNMSPVSPNLTANITLNMTSPADNTTLNATSNVTLNQSANLTNPAALNATMNGTTPAANSTQNVSMNAATGGTSQGTIPPVGPLTGTKLPLLLIKIGQISLIGFFIGVVLIVLYQIWLERIKRSQDVRGVYGTMCKLASFSKSGPQPFETPAEYGLRLSSIIRGQGQAIAEVAHIYAESRFSRKRDLPAEKRADLERAWFQIYPVLIKRAFRLR